MMKISRKTRWISIALIYIGLVFLLSLRNPLGGQYSLIREILTNLAHVPLYGILGCLLVILFKHLRTGVMAFFYAIFCGMTVAGFDEFLQSFVPGRTVSRMDLMLDLTGICRGILMFRIGRSKITKQKMLKGLGGAQEV